MEKFYTPAQQEHLAAIELAEEAAQEAAKMIADIGGLYPDEVRRILVEAADKAYNDLLYGAQQESKSN